MRPEGIIRTLKVLKGKLALSVFCIALALFDTFWKSLSPISAGALAVAVVPWVIRFIEKLNMPGGLEIVFSKAEERIEASHRVPDKEDISAFNHFESRDPNLAIAMLRVQIERRLRQIGEDVGLPPSPNGRPKSLRALAAELAHKGHLSMESASLINDLMPVMNEAAHGIELKESALDFAINYGPKILAMIKSD